MPIDAQPGRRSDDLERPLFQCFGQRLAALGQRTCQVQQPKKDPITALFSRNQNIRSHDIHFSLNNEDTVFTSENCLLR